ncbi:MAG: glycoside hydrolase family 43 protein [Dysgonamonadaceae bacterium]|jgi:beta-xylosidase|nr:glycoside hydrolase family 43 protein [Dysgonamonadaceae bacterium]
MKRLYLSILLISFSLILYSQSREKSLEKVPFGDPFIMLYGDTYYAYGTSAANGIAVYTSKDLLTWKAVEQLALQKEDTWTDRKFWAPEVYHVKGKFYMYFSANEHICVAVGDNPLGPFRQPEKKPMIEDEKCIDNSLFIDDDGKSYLFFDRFNDGLNIWSAELEDDLIHIKPNTLKKCIHVSQDWEKVWPKVNEGGFITKHNGIYYLTYSANSYECQCYGIGYATATNINGPWTKHENNPIYQNVKDLVGIGHSAMFKDKDGKLRIVFHAHCNQSKIHPRHMYISTVDFIVKDGKEVMEISTEYLTPKQFK